MARRTTKPASKNNHNKTDTTSVEPADSASESTGAPRSTTTVSIPKNENRGNVDLATEENITMAQGRRTNIRVELNRVQLSQDSDGMEDPDSFFAAAASTPAKSNPDSSTKTRINERRMKSSDERRSDGVDNSTGSLMETASRSVVRFSLPGGGNKSLLHTPPSSPGGDHSDNNSGTARVLSRLATNRSSLSPSELSKVSTAPPSTDRSIATLGSKHTTPIPKHNDEDESLFSVVRHARHRQDDIGGIAPLMKNVTPTATFPEDGDEFPSASDGFYDDGEVDDDFIPPPPPLDHDDDYAEKALVDGKDSQSTNENKDIESETRDHGKIESPHSDDEGDTGEGEMSPSPRLAVEVTAAKAKKRKEKDKASAAKNDKKEVIHKKVMKSKKRKASQTKAFNSKGIQSGPIEHRIVPISDIKPSTPDDRSLRRSQRARIQPLQWWKNERLEYGPNPDLDDSDVPVAKAVAYAEPTPYKERRIPSRAIATLSAKKANKTTTLSNEKNVVDDDRNIDVEEPYDSTKIRRKYQYIDGEAAAIWDDVIEEPSDERKCFNGFSEESLVDIAWFPHTCVFVNGRRCVISRKCYSSSFANTAD
jgi:centromere protein C